MEFLGLIVDVENSVVLIDDFIGLDSKDAKKLLIFFLSAYFINKLFHMLDLKLITLLFISHLNESKFNYSVKVLFCFVVNKFWLVRVNYSLNTVTLPLYDLFNLCVQVNI